LNPIRLGFIANQSTSCGVVERNHFSLCIRSQSLHLPDLCGQRVDSFDQSPLLGQGRERDGLCDETV
jgi:hypothetical protein